MLMKLSREVAAAQAEMSAKFSEIARTCEVRFVVPRFPAMPAATGSAVLDTSNVLPDPRMFSEVAR